jgi:hypothetical protein
LKLVTDLKWIELKHNIIQGLPLHSDIRNNAITDYSIKLTAYNNQNYSTSISIAILVFPELFKASNFIQISINGNFDTFNQNLTAKVALTIKLSEPDPDSFYIYNISNGSIILTYTNTSISNHDCIAYREWIDGIYSNNEYSNKFKALIDPFEPVGNISALGECFTSSSTVIIETVLPTILVEEDPISNRFILLVLVVPIAVLVCLMLVIGFIAFMAYRRKRPEREYIPLHNLYLNRKPIILPGELDSVPYRSRKPTVLTDEMPRRYPRGYRSYLHDSPTIDSPSDDSSKLIEHDSLEELVDFPVIEIHHESSQDLPPLYRFPPKL